MDSQKAEGSSQAETHQNDFFKQMLPYISQYLNVKDLLKVRPTCKLWNKVILDNHSDKWKFTVCNNPLSIDAFKNLSSSFVSTFFAFEGLDMEAKLFENPEVFRRFAMGQCLHLKYLSIRNCQFSTGRFFELLAFCRKLKKLSIKSTPSIYAMNEGIGIFNWGFAFKYVRKNLANLDNLMLHEKILSHRDFFGLARGMENLTSLNVSTENYLPMLGINEVLKACSQTMKHVQLRGEIMYPGLNIGPNVEMKALERISLLRSKMTSGHTVKQFELFLQRCPKLQMLKLMHCYVDQSTLSSVVEQLTSLEIIACDFGDGAFEDAQFEKLTLLRLLSNTDNISEPSVFEGAVENLLKGDKPELRLLELELSYDGANLLKQLDAARYPKLKVLSLIDCVDIAGRNLRNIFKDFQSLESLSIKNCKDLVDDNVCSTDDINVPYLADLKQLKTLNLEGTGVGNRSVEECIVKMSTLEDIYLSNTEVDSTGLQAIIESAENHLTSLKNVRLKTCPIPTSTYEYLSKIAPSVNIECETCSGP